MDYFEVIPIDLVEIIVSFLDKKDLRYFTDEYEYNYLVDFSHIHLHRYGIYGSIEKYLRYLDAEKLKKWVPEKLGEMSLDGILNLTHLNLKLDTINSIQSEISVLTNLEVLDLNSNNLGPTIPTGIYNLTKLVDLSLNNNNITTIPAEIGNLTNLRALALNNNNITTIPAEMGNLTNLRALLLSDNKVSYLPPEIGNLTNLQALVLSNNKVSYLPPEIGNLTNLQSLMLDNNSSLKELPYEVDKLINLNFLTIYNTGINKDELSPNLQRVVL